MMRRLAARLGLRRAPAAPSLQELKRDTPGLHRLFPQNGDHLAALAAHLFARGHFAQGLACVSEARSHGYDAGRAAAIVARGHVLRKEYRQALEVLEPELRDGKAGAETHEMAAVAYFHLKQIPEAHRHYQEAVRLEPREGNLRGSLAGVLDHYDRFEEAIEEAKRALRYDPRSAVALKNLAIAYGALARDADEERALRRGLLFHPDDAELQFQYGFFKLQHGEFSEGWRLYDRRLEVDPDSPKVRASTMKRPRWHGEPFAGKTLLVFGEQGAGDNIMVARYFPEIKQRGGRVVLEVAPPLAGVLGRMEGVDEVIPLDMVREPAVRYDLWIASMSVPLALGIDPARRQAPVRYLGATPDSVSYWRERMAPYAGKKVGIAWSGNPLHKNDVRRSIPFELIRPLLDTPGVTFFNLQLSPGWSAESPRPDSLVDFTEELLTFDDTAGLAECMDLVISVDTSVAHLAGALGKPTWLLVPYIAEWRWGLRGETTHWYPSMRVLRQAVPGDWRGLLIQTRERLLAA
jgi:tetratricopeptide (TPR) repeat protein